MIDQERRLPFERSHGDETRLREREREREQLLRPRVDEREREERCQRVRESGAPGKSMRVRVSRKPVYIDALTKFSGMIYAIRCMNNI